MSSHVVSLRVYLSVFASLILLTGATVALAYRDLGALNVLVALVIANVKMLLVALYFMHLRYSERLERFVAGAGVLWLLFLMALTLADFLTRAWLRR